MDFLKSKGLKLTKQRGAILEVFLKTEDHLSVEDLYRIAKRKDKTIGQATVFRTLKLLCEADLAKKIDLGDKKKRFEHKYKHSHHDHLYCVECGKIIEFQDSQIEKLQEGVCRKNKFRPLSHTLRIKGLCQGCKKKR